MSTPPVSLSKITQIAVVAHDTDRATAFYRDTLGMKFLFAAPPQLSFFDAGGVRLMISPPEPEHDHPGSILYFDVPDIDAAHAALTAKGVSFGSTPHRIAVLGTQELWLCEFKDSEGNPLALMAMKPAAG